MLLTLPTETLALIIHHLGPDFFRQDLHRLTVAKRWYSLAQEELWRRVSFSKGRGINHILQKYLRDRQAIPTWARNKTQVLELSLPGRDLGHVGQQTLDSLSHGFGEAFAQATEPGRCPPAELLQELRCLRRLKLSVVANAGAPTPWRQVDDLPWAYVVPGAITSISKLMLPLLRELDLMLVGDSFLAVQDGHRWHTCPAIRALLVKLTSLSVVHLTLSHVCPTIFAKERENAKMAFDTLHIESNYWDRDIYNPALVADIRSQVVRLGEAAKGFVSEMEMLPRMVRIVWPNHVSRYFHEGTPEQPCLVYAWDCLVDECRTFDERESWDSGGTLIDLEEDYEHWRKKQQAAHPLPPMQTNDHIPFVFNYSDSNDPFAGLKDSQNWSEDGYESNESSDD